MATLKKGDSLPELRETPDGMHENEPLPSANVPNYPPSVLMLEGTVGDYCVSVPGWSYTVMRTVVDMYGKAAQRLKRSADLHLYDTGGKSWNRSDWTILQKFHSSPRAK